ncbi:Rv1733c family protein [Nocardia jiangxiensis]|uniref:Uncharacterized protein n=1 Tax=Nocardia jiangxiensis TaxID=282685 RepID=A0ABW6RXH9_9NOCA|nr:hypothetical protein [Nocardia jiangxiensis]
MGIDVTNRPSLPRRLWRTAPWSANPLMRASDRWEAGARIVAVVLLLAAIPFAVHAGTARYDEALVHERAVIASAVTVAGTVTERPTVVGQDSVAAVRTWQTQVVWTRAGHTHTATIDVPSTARPGDRFPVRVGGDGRPLHDLSPTDLALGDGVDRAMKVFGSVALVVGAVLAVLYSLLEIRRRADWTREWRGLSREVNRG